MTGCKHKTKCRATERVDEVGERVSVQQVTVLNMLEFPVNELKFKLSPQERQSIQDNGIYCLEFESVLPHFIYSDAQHWCTEVWEESRTIMQAGPSWTDVATVLLLVARPQYETDPTFVNYGDCIPDCDTNSYPDTMKCLEEVMQRTVGSLVRLVMMLLMEVVHASLVLRACVLLLFTGE